MGDVAALGTTQPAHRLDLVDGLRSLSVTGGAAILRGALGQGLQTAVRWGRLTGLAVPADSGLASQVDLVAQWEVRVRGVVERAQLIAWRCFGMAGDMSALIIKSPHIDRILAGEKSWELRGTRTAKRGLIALVKSGANEILGVCEVVDVVGPLDLDQLRDSLALHRDPDDLKAPPYSRTYAWVVKHPVKFDAPIPYRNPPGAVIWVRLPSDVAARVCLAYSYALAADQGK